MLRLIPGQEVKEALEEYVRRHAPRGVFVMTCCGSVTSATLRLAANTNGETNKRERERRTRHTLTKLLISSLLIHHHHHHHHHHYHHYHHHHHHHHHHHQIKTYNQHFEVLSLSGTLSKGGTHLHICLSDNEGGTVGGHVMGGLRVFTTMEVALGEPLDLTLDRAFDDSTGFPELTITRDAEDSASQHQQKEGSA
ncbi:Bifunctional protein GlmU [Portunus trituberculatus]|uniref:Bifunctional protein GlmU n=1 Tax=Portunus trituberculatus TaxID=210409 RepID=A0A5B7HC85_PORTR|nr:Bifunctional protein GlmU [Portunus trituberculatus]